MFLKHSNGISKKKACDNISYEIKRMFNLKSFTAVFLNEPTKTYFKKFFLSVKSLNLKVAFK